MEGKDYEDMCIQIILNHRSPLDMIITCNFISFEEKMYIIDSIIEITNKYYPDYHLNITSKTISLFLQIKKEEDAYIACFTKIINFCSLHCLNAFTYIHLYHLVLQIWMDSPNNIVTNDFRKKLITIGINGTSKELIFNQIKMNLDIWFINIDKNQEVAELIDLICHLDDTGQLTSCKVLYEKKEKEKTNDIKIFQKKYNMTPHEYQIHQQIAKENGLCKYIREGKVCPRKTECIFYHGCVEETYGIQKCKYGTKCKHIIRGECKFVHEPSDEQMDEIKKFYNSLKRIRNTNIFLVERHRSSYIDSQCLINPFIVLKKKEIIGKFVHYQIPFCSHQIENEYGIKHACRNHVRFMTKQDGKISNFYCCYEHMNANEPGCSYVVKQNVLGLIFSNTINEKCHY
jgi:hypothetical protein